MWIDNPEEAHASRLAPDCNQSEGRAFFARIASPMERLMLTTSCVKLLKCFTDLEAFSSLRRRACDGCAALSRNTLVGKLIWLFAAAGCFALSLSPANAQATVTLDRATAITNGLKICDSTDTFCIDIVADLTNPGARLPSASTAGAGEFLSLIHI